MKKQFLTIADVSKLTGLSKSSIYKLTSARVIPFYKPFGKRIFMTQEQIDEMMTRVRIKSRTELQTEIEAGGKHVQ